MKRVLVLLGFLAGIGGEYSATAYPARDLISHRSIAPFLLAQTCTANCGSRQIQFTPGQPIRLQMSNRTASLVRVQQRPLTDTIALPPGAEVEISSNFGTEPNLSVIFWDETYLAVRAVLFRPETNVLRIELIPGAGTGDRSVYIENDGRVRLF
ncbi:hypothetical protein C7B61_14240 [filamentous cyanobacterium CCP1]|nr:hypothetical protein C7B76_23640 [filamentous cyanobacterium CCP2]PSB62702.1 hypothetical protein C7B61_14240 [filamentous cyanobacterium CCP1]